MPTGYTAGVTDSTTLTEFAWTCARAMGALVMMRDEPTGAPIPQEFAPSAFYLERMDEARARLASVREWTDHDAVADMTAEIDRDKRVVMDLNAEAIEKTNAYNKLLSKVIEWEPPTSDHVGLQDFMIQQLTTSRDHDGHQFETRVKVVSPQQWKAQQLAKAEEDYQYAEREWNAEVHRTQERNEWLKALRENLPPGGSR